jgi:hypothetical protein
LHRRIATKVIKRSIFFFFFHRRIATKVIKNKKTKSGIATAKIEIENLRRKKQKSEKKEKAKNEIRLRQLGQY